ncbi:hypothetical protein EJ05DRAFT_539098 [Pseudovirgaria hyperparasitica]|uniref:Zn(2)-C6 fungal-type domain-containing protein n=1 Tax=Pseudovirgaria hyperparasitica TaxID=470096 RepID=A0A6A6W4X4_9PEZI|nr:uncharacterized protein EJ05DRAFT_539098 [Pseudovirgaria hyperparasitica]KAF2757006.1 hypothetical protein EJ05DRAFT_539098 [Pseudovirgaria hyperparasitica]
MDATSSSSHSDPDPNFRISMLPTNSGAPPPPTPPPASTAAVPQHPPPQPAADLLKRKRSADDHPAHPAQPPPKSAKTNNHLQINYLARQFAQDLPLASTEDTLPSILTLLGDYQGVLDRHESMACNLGARPLGPILISRFERLFDGPPKVLKSHGKDGASVSWLDVVEFARNKPEQFQLGQMSEGARVCQFYTKQCRVQISEEDFVLISSGIPQKMIPPQPIIEDEEKELGTIEILEKNLGQICHLADQVAARTRQLKHRLKLRQQAILDRRATDNPPAVRASSSSTMALINGSGPPPMTHSPNAGFVPVNARTQHGEQNGGPAGAGDSQQQQQQQHAPPASHSHPHSSSTTTKNGASSATRSELMSKFFTLNDRRQQSSSSSNGDSSRRASIVQSHSSSTAKKSANPAAFPPHEPSDYSSHHHQHQQQHHHHHHQHSTTSPVPIPNTPSSLLPHHTAPSSRALPPAAEKDDGGPYKTEMVLRMESLSKGERILPPCDRCRRLHMDCLKNLTACAGCTKKHAKCSWREVREGEIRSGFAEMARLASLGQSGGGGGAQTTTTTTTTAAAASSGGIDYGDMSDEPASVGQRTPPPRPYAQPPQSASLAHAQPQSSSLAHTQSAAAASVPPHGEYKASPAQGRSPTHRSVVGHDDSQNREKSVESQLQEAARLAGVEAEAQAYAHRDYDEGHSQQQQQQPQHRHQRDNSEQQYQHQHQQHQHQHQHQRSEHPGYQPSQPPHIGSGIEAQ